MKRVTLVALATVALGACTLQPLYGGGGRGVVAQTMRGVTVASIPGRAGFLVRSALVDRLGEPDGAARYRLVDAQSGQVMLDATAGSDAGVDVISSEYATVAAEATALENLSREVADQIISRVALFASRTDMPDSLPAPRPADAAQ